MKDSVTGDHMGRRVKALAEARGVAPEEMAQALETSVSTVYRRYGRAQWPRRDVEAAADLLGTTVAALRSDSSAAPKAPPTTPDTTEPAASGTGGLGVGSERELWERIGYYRGKQELALENSETSSRLAREASEMLDRAIRALREVHEHTVPMPRGMARELTARQLAEQTAGDLAALEADERAALAQRQEQAAAKRRRAGGKGG